MADALAEAVRALQAFDASLSRPPFTAAAATRARPHLDDLNAALAAGVSSPELPEALRHQLPVLFTAYCRGAEPHDAEVLTRLAESCARCAQMGPLGYPLAEAAEVVLQAAPSHPQTLALLRAAEGLSPATLARLFAAVDACSDAQAANDVLSALASHNLTAESTATVVDWLRGDAFRVRVRTCATADAVLTRWFEPLVASGLKPVDLLEVVCPETFGFWVDLCDRSPSSMAMVLRALPSRPARIPFGDDDESRQRCLRECLRPSGRLFAGRLLAAVTVLLLAPSSADASMADSVGGPPRDAARVSARAAVESLRGEVVEGAARWSPTAFIVGGMSKGQVEAAYAARSVSIAERPMSAAATCSKICEALEAAWANELVPPRSV